MAIPVDTLMEEAKCYLCLGISIEAAMELALLNRIASGSVKVYRALLTQAGVAAPVATVLENSLGGTPVWSYSGAGQYTMTLAGAFPSGKTFLNIRATGDPGATTDLAGVTRISDNAIFVGTGDPATATYNDNVLDGTSIEILVYP